MPPGRLRVPELDFRPTMPAWMGRAVERFGDRPLIVTPTSSMTYAEVDQAARQLARTLIGHGLGKASRVGIFAPYGAEWLVSWIATTRIGALAVPLATSYRPAELRRALRFADVDTLLASPRMFGRDQREMLEAAVPGLVGAPGWAGATGSV